MNGLKHGARSRETLEARELLRACLQRRAGRNLDELGRARIKNDGRRELLVRNPALRGIATATPATIATAQAVALRSVATVATVAVAEGENLEGDGEGIEGVQV